MNDPHDQTATLIAIEHGASWPSWGNQVRDRGLNLVVEAQLPHESLADLHARIAHRIAREKAAGMRLLAAGYVCSLATHEPASVESRLAICRMLLDELDETTPAPPAVSSETSSTDWAVREKPPAPAGKAPGPHPLGDERSGESSYWSSPAQLILGSGGWKGSQAEPYARALLMDLWSRLSGLLPGKVVSLRFDESPGESGAYPAARRHQELRTANSSPAREPAAAMAGSARRSPQVRKSYGPSPGLTALAANGDPPESEGP